MRILVLADIDELHWPAGGGEADLLLSCGDLFDQVIVEAAQAYHCPQVFAVKGNKLMLNVTRAEFEKQTGAAK